MTDSFGKRDYHHLALKKEFKAVYLQRHRNYEPKSVPAFPKILTGQLFIEVPEGCI